MRKQTRSALFRALPISFVCLSAPAALAEVQQDRDSDYNVEIAVVSHQMAFDKTEFTVSAGSEVSIYFTNNDGMIHNLIVASQPGGEEVYMDIARMVMNLGAEAHERQYVPDTDLVLAYSKLLQPGESDTITFTAPEETGPYPYVCTIPGHPRSMNGIMNVTPDGKPPEDGRPKSGFSELTYRYYEGQWTEVPDFAQLDPVGEGRMPDALINLDARQQDDYFGFVFQGKLPVEEAGEHVFLMRSDDGSMLYINDELLIEHDGIHGDGEVKYAETHLDAGTHDVRVEYFEHTGSFNLVLDWAGPTEEELPPLTDNQRNADVRRFIVEIEDKPQVWRVLLPNSPARAISVGLPEKISYSFDAETASVQLAWQGDFINRGNMIGHGQGRGPGSVQILGTGFNIGAVQRPLRIGDPDKEPEIRFHGYRTTEDQVIFMYEVDGSKVSQIIEAAPDGSTGLRHHFEFAEAPAQPVYFLINGEGLQIESSTGSWNGNHLTVPVEEAQRFTITLTNPAP